MNTTNRLHHVIIQSHPDRFAIPRMTANSLALSNCQDDHLHNRLNEVRTWQIMDFHWWTMKTFLLFSDMIFFVSQIIGVCARKFTPLFSVVLSSFFSNNNIVLMTSLGSAADSLMLMSSLACCPNVITAVFLLL